MRRASLLLAVISVQAASVAAQQVPATINASLPSESGKPLPVIGRFWFVFDGGRDSVSALTDGTGRARVNLPLGNYRLRSHQRVTLAGRTYYWDLPVSVRTTMLVELSDANAQNTPPAVVPAALVMEAADPPPAQAPTSGPAPVTPTTATRQGFWIGFGFGYGSWGCEGCDDTIGSFSGTFRLGGTLSPHLRLGASTNGWYKSEDGATLSMANLSAVLMIYPSASDGFHFTLGVGTSVLVASLSGFGSESEVGGGAIIGLGYDLMVARRFALTPYVNVVAGGFDGGYAYFAQFGLAATWP